ncbi:unnamed protein product [Ambrosiozyma monospora]|uniref:Mediator of RNA polymerase II transcription subunit 14 n=1 Tax=Ambrosiozyma monospora TaxID=43982 RepID=A0A9W7DI52_AMBMO|nr:unnamed protein product [Ambrosiozyma monospora]
MGNFDFSYAFCFLKTRILESETSTRTTEKRREGTWTFTRTRTSPSTFHRHVILFKTMSSSQMTIDNMNQQQQSQMGLAPPIPHISANMTPLDVVLKRQSQYTYKQLKEFIKTLRSSTSTDNLKKKQFLDLLVQIRENFIRLYVLSKWARNSHSIEKLIDLFVWLREQNQAITNALMTIGSINQQLVSAKLPNPDLTTALEVLIKGRPQLPTYDFIPAKPLNPALSFSMCPTLSSAQSL